MILAITYYNNQTQANMVKRREKLNLWYNFVFCMHPIATILLSTNNTCTLVQSPLLQSIKQSIKGFEDISVVMLIACLFSNQSGYEVAICSKSFSWKVSQFYPEYLRQNMQIGISGDLDKIWLENMIYWVLLVACKKNRSRWSWSLYFVSAAVRIIWNSHFNSKSNGNNPLLGWDIIDIWHAILHSPI
jgi:hypothetical protein